MDGIGYLVLTKTSWPGSTAGVHRTRSSIAGWILPETQHFLLHLNGNSDGVDETPCHVRRLPD